MRSRTRTLVVLLAAAAAVALVAAGCGGGGGGGGGSTTTTQKSSFKAALVSDIAGFNDNGFNKNQLKGLNNAASQLGITPISKVSHSSSDYQPNYNAAIRAGSNIVIAAGFLLGDTMKKYAKQYPKVDFAITDDPVSAVGGYKNEIGITYATEEAGCLVGVLAAKQAEQMGKKIIGAVGGIKIPSVDTYIAGYQAGAKAADPGVRTINGYSQDFVAQAKCKEVALNQIASGSVVVFQVAGGCGLGALDAAKEKNVWGIGVDADQGYLGTYVLTSALKRVDTAVYDAIKDAKEGHFKGGTDAVYGLDKDGVGIGRFSPKAPKGIAAKVAKIKQQIVSGKIKNIPTTVK